MNSITLTGTVASTLRKGFAKQINLLEFDIYHNASEHRPGAPPNMEAWTVAAFGELATQLETLLQIGDEIMVLGRMRQYSRPSDMGGPRIPGVSISATAVAFAPSTVAAKIMDASAHSP